MPYLTPSRRALLKLACAAPALALPAPMLAAVSGPGDAGNPAYHRFMLGQFRMTVISDGHLLLPAAGLAASATLDEVMAFLQTHKLSTEENYSHTNHLLIETGDHTVLVDVGSGNRFLPTAGRLVENLESAGFAPDDITHVIITHAHPDHIWGIRDDFDEPLFPSATYVIGAAEHDWWRQDGLVNTVPPEMQQMVVGAVNALNVDGVDWLRMQDGDAVVPGITMMATPGHTPGHMSVHIESDGNRLIALADSMTHAYISIERPTWHGGFDQNGDQAAGTRARLLDMAATDGMTVIGYHFPFPGVGHIMRADDGYRFVPTLWRWG